MIQIRIDVLSIMLSIMYQLCYMGHFKNGRLQKDDEHSRYDDN